jgi:hypothetical protein
VNTVDGADADTPDVFFAHGNLPDIYSSPAASQLALPGTGADSSFSRSKGKFLQKAGKLQQKEGGSARTALSSHESIF